MTLKTAQNTHKHPLDHPHPNMQMKETQKIVLTFFCLFTQKTGKNEKLLHQKLFLFAQPRTLHS
jgi:hypothetical protein